MSILVKFYLPLLWINTLFGNQLWSDDLLIIAKYSHWISIFIAILIIFKFSKNIIIALTVLFLLMLDIFLIKFNLPFSYSLNILTLTTIYALSGNYVLINYENNFESFMRRIILVSIPIMILQVIGISDWLHIFNTLRMYTDEYGDTRYLDSELMPMLFQDSHYLRAFYLEDFKTGLTSQIRPPGLFHSNAMNAIFILFAAAIFSNRRKELQKKLPYFFIILAAFLSGAKLAVFGVFILGHSLFIYCKEKNYLEYFKFLIEFFFIGYLYYIFFPAAVENNFNFDALLLSFGSRIADALIFLSQYLEFNLPKLEILDSFFNWKEDFEGLGVLSNIGYLILVSPLIIVLVMLVYPIYHFGIKALV